MARKGPGASEPAPDDERLCRNPARAPGGALESMRLRREKCVDASLAIKVVVREHNSDQADTLFERWRVQHQRLVAPAFFDVESDSILRTKVAVTKPLTPEQAA